MKTRSPHAFTLVELLTVMGLMVLMAGGLGLALHAGSQAVALETGQGMLASLVTAARTKATLDQARVMLVVDADPADERFLRGLHLAVEATPDSGHWLITEDSVVLPPGIFLVPGIVTPEGVAFPPSGGVAARAWPATRRSSLEILPPDRIALPLEGPPEKFLGLAAPFSPRGMAGAGGGDKLVLTAGRRSVAGVILDRPEQIRGVALSSYGVAILINDGPGFDF